MATERWTWMRRVSSVGAAVVLCMTMTGCFDRRELEEQAFVTSMGVDAAPGGLMDCTLQIALPKSPAAGGGGGSSGKSPLAGESPVTFRAHTIMEALTLANSSVERRLNVSHLTNILFGEDMARRGLEPRLQPLVRFREFRRTILISVCRGTARDYMTAMKPMLEQSPERVTESIMSVGQLNQRIPVTRIHDFIRSLESLHQSPITPLVAVNTSVKKDPKGEKGDIPAGVSVEAGHVHRLGGNPAEWMGAAVFRRDKLVGFLNGDEVAYLWMLRGLSREQIFDFQDPLSSGDRVAMTLRGERKPAYDVRLTNPVRISVEVPLEADLASTSSGIDYSDGRARKKLEQELGSAMSHQLKSLIERLLGQYHTDVIPISEYIRPQFSTHQALAAYPWDETSTRAQVSVHVTLHVRRFGVQMVPIQTRT